MAYTYRQKANYYLDKFNAETFNPVLSKLYWQLYKGFDSVDKATQNLMVYRKDHPIRKPSDYKNLKLV